MAANTSRENLVVAFVEEVEVRRTADMSFRDDPKLAALPTCSEGGGRSRYLLLAAAIDATTASTGIRPLLAGLDRRVCALGCERGLFDVTLDHEQLVLDTIAARQRRGELRGWQIRAHVPRILAEANAFVDRLPRATLTRGRGDSTPHTRSSTSSLGASITKVATARRQVEKRCGC